MLSLSAGTANLSTAPPSGTSVDVFCRPVTHLGVYHAALEGIKEDERQANEWKQDAASAAYLAALELVNVRMAERWRRDAIRKDKIFVLSTQVADGPGRQ